MNEKSRLNKEFKLPTNWASTNLGKLIHLKYGKGLITKERIPGDFEAQEYLEAIDEIQRISRILQVPGGIHIVEPDPKALDQAVRSGNRFIAYGVDTRMLDTVCREGLDTLKDPHKGSAS